MSERGSLRASYTAAFKLRVVGYAVEHGNRAAGKKFAVDESCVRPWRIQREKLATTPKFKRAFWSTAFSRSGEGTSLLDKRETSRRIRSFY